MSLCIDLAIHEFGGLEKKLYWIPDVSFAEDVSKKEPRTLP